MLIQRPISPSSSATSSCPSSLPLWHGFLPGFTTPTGPAAAIQGEKRAVKGLGGRASFWRKALAYWGRGKHAKVDLHKLLFHFHTLHANALWKVPSRFPPRGSKGGRGWARMEGSSLTVSACPWGKPPVPSDTSPVQTHPGADQGPSPSCLGLQALESSLQDAHALLQPPPRKFWSGAVSQSFLSVLFVALGGNPESFIGCPMSLLALQVHAD